MSRYFSKKELACSCCGVCRIDPGALMLLNNLREEYGQPIFLTSAYRCPKHNKAVGGAKNSAHVEGLAFDIRITSDRERDKIVELSFKYGFTGRGYGKTFQHIDIKDRGGYGTCWFY